MNEPGLPPVPPAPVTRALEARYYIDPALFQREQQGLFARTWQFAGHVSEIPDRGDYFTFEVAGESLFCIRGKEGTPRTLLQCLPTPGAPAGPGGRHHPGRRLPLSRLDL